MPWQGIRGAGGISRGEKKRLKKEEAFFFPSSTRKRKSDSRATSDGSHKSFFSLSLFPFFFLSFTCLLSLARPWSSFSLGSCREQSSSPGKTEKRRRENGKREVAIKTFSLESINRP